MRMNTGFRCSENIFILAKKHSLYVTFFITSFIDEHSHVHSIGFFRWHHYDTDISTILTLFTRISLFYSNRNKYLSEFNVILFIAVDDEPLARSLHRNN